MLNLTSFEKVMEMVIVAGEKFANRNIVRRVEIVADIIDRNFKEYVANKQFEREDHLAAICVNDAASTLSRLHTYDSKLKVMIEKLTENEFIEVVKMSAIEMATCSNANQIVENILNKYQAAS